MKKKVYLVDVTETFKARIAVRAEDEDAAESLADELVGGGRVSIVNLANHCTPDTDYHKECDVVCAVTEKKLRDMEVYG